MMRSPLHALDAAVKIASEYASSVDQEGRFPIEAISALKSGGLIGLLPAGDAGSLQDNLTTTSIACYHVARACGSSGLIYAMHLSQLACLVALSHSSRWHAAFLDAVIEDQLLLGSVTSEAGVGGDIRTSLCSLQLFEDEFVLEKRAPTASYAMYADALLITARRDAEASSSDQILIVVTREMLEISEVRRWDTLGMRGTCSGAYELRARGRLEQVGSLSFPDVAEQVMLPVSHVLWGSVWLGIAAGSVERARTFLSKKARSAAGDRSPSYANGAALRLERAAAGLRTMHARLQTAIASVRQHQADLARGKAVTVAFIVAINDLKITLSDLALSIVLDCMQICGTEGYRNDSPFSLTRQLRDIQSAPLMVNNDRIASNNSQLALVQKTLASVF